MTSGLNKQQTKHKCGQFWPQNFYFQQIPCDPKFADQVPHSAKPSAEPGKSKNIILGKKEQAAKEQV